MKNCFLYPFYCLFAIGTIFLCCQSLFAQKVAEKKYKDYPQFEKNVFVVANDTLPYRLLLPENYDKNQKYPLLLFLHGSGERGNNNLIPLTHIAPAVLDADFRKNYPCIVVVPQCPKGKRWVEVDWKLATHTQPKEMSEPMTLLRKLLDKNIYKNYKIDKKRIYITGLSMGGFGTWDMMARYPKEFTAGVPVCGGADENTAKSLKEMPIWTFHGALDKVVSPDRTRNMVKAMEIAQKDLGKEDQNKKITYTEFSHIEHDSWKQAYANKDMWKWLFEQKK